MELYAIKYGESLFPSEKVFYDDDLNTGIFIHWLFYVIKYNDKNILVDTGFSKQSWVKKFEVKMNDSLELLSQIDIKPEQVTDVLVTHTHFDHFENILYYKNAKVFIQKDELDWYLETDGHRDEAVRRYLEDNPNINTFADSYTLYDTLEIKKIGGHSVGSCVVSFDYMNVKYVLTGDECYLNENVDRKRPIGLNVDMKKNADFINSLKETYDVIYTFHNPEIVRNSSNIERLIP
jgi:glyoxylase-like metal-dependent hydrolase (beta-lactamase superfamily II)